MIKFLVGSCLRELGSVLKEPFEIVFYAKNYLLNHIFL